MFGTTARWRFEVTILVVVLGVAGTASGVPGQDRPDAVVKAAMIYNFAKFVEWPGLSGDETLRICTLRAGPTMDALESFEGMPVHGLPLLVERRDLDAELADCHVLYVETPEKRLLIERLDVLETEHVLVVSDFGDTSGGAPYGAINLFRSKDTIRFDIDRTAFDRSRLRVSALLLQLAATVHEAAAPEPRP